MSRTGSNARNSPGAGGVPPVIRGGRRDVDSVPGRHYLVRNGVRTSVPVTARAWGYGNHPHREEREMEHILVAVIVLAAAVLLVRHFLKRSASDDGCGCSCDTCGKRSGCDGTEGRR